VQPTGTTNDPSWSVIARAAAGDPAARSKVAATCLPVVRSFLELRWRGTPLEGELTCPAELRDEDLERILELLE